MPVSGWKSFNDRLLLDCRQYRRHRPGRRTVSPPAAGRLFVLWLADPRSTDLADVRAARARAAPPRRQVGAVARVRPRTARADDDRLLDEHHAASRRAPAAHSPAVDDQRHLLRAHAAARRHQAREPRLDRFMASPPRRADCRPENRPWVTVPAAAGTVVLLDWLRHEVPPNPVAAERIGVPVQLQLVLSQPRVRPEPAGARHEGTCAPTEKTHVHGPPPGRNSLRPHALRLLLRRPPIPVVAHVDLERFMGDWYVIANIPTFVEKGAHNAVESYRARRRRHDRDHVHVPRGMPSTGGEALYAARLRAGPRVERGLGHAVRLADQGRLPHRLRRRRLHARPSSAATSATTSGSWRARRRFPPRTTSGCARCASWATT